MLLEVGVALAPVARLHLIVPVQVLQRCPGDVDAPGDGEMKVLSPPCPAPPPQTPAQPPHPSSPSFATRFHVVGEGDIVGPDIELPLAQPQDAAVNAPTVDAHTHVHVHPRHLTH